MVFQDGTSVWSAQLTDPGTGLEADPAQVGTGPAQAIARSPDGLQLLLGRDAEVDIELLSDSVWESQGGFALPGKARAVTYDASGSQAVVLYDVDGGSGYCELH